MNANELLKKLDLWNDDIPENLLRQAVKHQKEVTPGLIAAIEKAARHPAEQVAQPESNLYYWAAYLLTHFEEPKAQSALIELFGLSGGPYTELVDDLVGEDGAMILANTAGGNFDPIFAILQDTKASDSLRSAAATAAGFLCAWGELDDEIVENEYRKTFLAMEKKGSGLSMDLVLDACDLNLRGLSADITRAYDRGVVDEDDYEMVVDWLHDPDFEPPPPFMHLNQAIDDIVEFFETKLEEEKMLEEMGLGDLEGLEGLDDLDGLDEGAGEDRDGAKGKKPKK
jgi:hypothetical protein